jgi:hypothetical protein
LFMIFDESGLAAEEREAAEYGARPGGGSRTKTWAQTQEMIEQGNRYAINGYVFGNLPGLEMNEGERVRWYLFGLGSEQDFHTAHWHGLRVVEEGRRRTDVVELLPASMKVADMVADNPGSWLFHCHVAEHMMEGMFARLVVHPKGSQEISRSAGTAFFGLPQAQQSLKISEAILTRKNSRDGTPDCELKLRGNVSVYEAFSAFVTPFRIQIGSKSATFRPDARGIAETAEGIMRVKNVGQYGVVYGGVLDFELILRGNDWLKEFDQLGSITRPSGSNTVPIILQVGDARHAVVVPVESQTR